MPASCTRHANADAPSKHCCRWRLTSALESKATLLGDVSPGVKQGVPIKGIAGTLIRGETHATRKQSTCLTNDGAFDRSMQHHLM